MKLTPAALVLSGFIFLQVVLGKTAMLNPSMGTMVNELLYREVFDTLNEAKVLLGRWMREYNTKCQWQFKM